MKRVGFTPSTEVVAQIEAKGNAALRQIVTSTPAQIDTWLSANVTNLAEARSALKVVILGLRYLLRKDRGLD